MTLPSGNATYAGPRSCRCQEPGAGWGGLPGTGVFLDNRSAEPLLTGEHESFKKQEGEEFWADRGLGTGLRPCASHAPGPEWAPRRHVTWRVLECQDIRVCWHGRRPGSHSEGPSHTQVRGCTQSSARVPRAGFHCGGGQIPRLYS